MYIVIVILNQCNIIIYTNRFVDAATVTSDSPVHSQPGSSQAKLNNLCEFQYTLI